MVASSSICLKGWVKTVLDSDEEINVGALMEDAYLDDADIDDEEDDQSPTYILKLLTVEFVA